MKFLALYIMAVAWLSSPLMALSVVDYNISHRQIAIRFDETLQLTPKQLQGFEVADKRYGRFIPATAVADGKKIILRYESYVSAKEQRDNVVWRYTGDATHLGCRTPLKSYAQDIPFKAVPLGQFPAVGKVRIACVGDSITHGFGIPNEQQRYPETLGRILGEPFLVGRFGNSGKTAGNYNRKQWFGAQKEFPQSLDFKADVYICNLGINDALPQRSEAGFEALIKAFRGPQNATVVLWGKLGPDFRGVPGKKGYPGNIFAGYTFRTRDNGTPVNRLIMEKLIAALAERYQCPTIDAYTEMAKDPELYKVDGLHPTPEGAAKLAKLTYDWLARYYRLPR